MAESYVIRQGRKLNERHCISLLVSTPTLVSYPSRVGVLTKTLIWLSSKAYYELVFRKTPNGVQFQNPNPHLGSKG
jgi:hypothetical protein